MTPHSHPRHGRPIGSRVRRRARGLSLIEVLVSILIFSFGLLGFVGLQSRAIQFSVSAEDTNRAALLANDLSAQMVTAGTLTLPAADVTAWQTRVGDVTGGGLPNGIGDVAVVGTVATITVTWRANANAAGTPNAENRYVTQVLLPT